MLPGSFSSCIFRDNGAVGRRCAGQPPFLAAVFWILRTGAPWRDLPASYGDWKNTHRRFCRWRDRGVWERLLEQLIDEPDMEWPMIDASHCKVHPPRCRGARWQ
jgi:transposase